MNPAADTDTNTKTNTNTNTDTETTRQEPPKTCTRTSRCSQQDCLICGTPTNHVRNLDAALDNSDGPPTSPPSSPTTGKPSPPPNHLILHLTTAFEAATWKNNVNDLKNLPPLYDQTMSTNLEFLFYDLTDLHTVRTKATQLIDAHTAASTPLPDSPPNGLLHAQPTSPPTASFKPPKLFTET